MNPMNPTVYVETSVISYLTSRRSKGVEVAAYQEITQEWWSMAPDRFSLVTSKLVVTEAASGDSDAARARLAALKAIPLVDVTVEAVELNRELVNRGAVPPSAADDAAHIATAAAHGLDYLVTWNFRHIANATMRPRIEDVCRSSGYEPPVICTPRELMETAHSGSTGLAMQGPRTDPIIGELHSIRDQHAARFGYDIDAILQDIRDRQETSGREYLRLPTREVT